MKNSKSLWICLFIIALLLSACSKDENEPIQNKSEELISLSFNISVLDMEKSSISKQEIQEFPECLDDDPFYIEIILMQEGEEMVGSAYEPFRIDLAPGEMFTNDVPELHLPPGVYYLDHCAVYNESGSVLCLAPKAGSPMGLFSDAPMPMNINLRAGTIPFADVPVMCYDKRDVNEYGYVFFDIDAIELKQYCFFANYCNDNGRHYPARYSLEVSINGNSLYNEEINTTGVNGNEEYYANPLCAVLPYIPAYEDDEEYIDYTIKLLPWDGVYDVGEEIEISGSLSKEDIDDHFEGDNNVEYQHIFFNCNVEEEEI